MPDRGWQCFPERSFGEGFGRTRNPYDAIFRHMANLSRRSGIRRSRKRTRSFVTGPLWWCDSYRATRADRGQVRTVSRTASGYRAATHKSTRAAPSGFLLPCSQLRSVAGLIPRSSANFCWVSPRCRRMAETSGSSRRNVLPGTFFPRSIFPPCLILVSNSSNVFFFTAIPYRRGDPVHVS